MQGFSFYDLAFITNTRDFINSVFLLLIKNSKIDELYYAARLSLNFVNCLSSIALIKYIIFNKQRVNIIDRLMKITLLINIIMIILLFFFHLRVIHVFIHMIKVKTT
jgi:hypothetical protein